MENNMDALAEIQRLEKALADARHRIRELENGNPAKNGHDNDTTVALMQGSEIAPIAIRWLWYGWLAEGKLEILAGAVATGKTTIAIDLAATITRGGKWPDGTQVEPGDVLVWSGEDDPEDTLLPRFVAAGGVRERIYFVKGVIEQGKPRAFDPSTDMTALALAAQSITALKLIIVDPVVLMVAGDSHKNTEVRRSLQPLADLASARSCTALGITHLTKGTAGRDPLERVTGSLAFTAGPRLVLMAAKPIEPEQKHRLVRIKSNIGPDGDGFEYSLMQEPLSGWEGIIGQRVRWGTPLTGRAHELLNEIEASEEDDKAPKRAAAAQFLLTLLANGPVPAAKIREQADAAGHSEITLRRAREGLGITSYRAGFPGVSFWRLPDDDPLDGEIEL
jgi:putative DNA primase/helicase